MPLIAWGGDEWSVLAESDMYIVRLRPYATGGVTLTSRYAYARSWLTAHLKSGSYGEFWLYFVMPIYSLPIIYTGFTGVGLEYKGVGWPLYLDGVSRLGLPSGLRTFYLKNIWTLGGLTGLTMQFYMWHIESTAAPGKQNYMALFKLLPMFLL